MFNSIVALLLACSLTTFAVGQETKPATTPAKPAAAAEDTGGFISPAELNVRIEPDVRTFVVMAALNMAGYDYETSGQSLSPARAELRRDLAKVNPRVTAAIAEYIKAHKRPGVDDASDAARYAALSLMMTMPPAFSIYQRDETVIPDDLRSLADGEFTRLIQQFYLTSGIRELVPKYLAVANTYAKAYRRPVGELIYEALEYFHTKPQTVINMRPLVVSQGAGARTKDQKQIFRTRTRHIFVVPDPLNAMNTSFVRDDILNQKEELISRRVGDDYVVIIGPARTFNNEAVRRALIRFIIDPIVERHLRTSLEFKDQILALVGSVPTAAKPFGSSVYLVIRESLAQAAEARLRRIDAKEKGLVYSEEEAVTDLAQAYLRGAVLAFHFYDSLIGLEKVGINIEDFFDQMLATTKFDREATRAKEFEPVVARVSAARKAAAKKAETRDPAASAMSTALSDKVLLSDDLIRQRRFMEARGILADILAVEPKSARALYGMAQIVSQTSSAVEADPKADENDKIQAQHERLEEALKLFRRAIANAAPAEQWLVQWSHVLIGRILDFQDFRLDAVAEYEKAIALGPIPNGAHKEAIEGKQRPFGQKQ
jgi:tetratricopeptide (TPR) repeat protein